MGWAGLTRIEDVKAPTTGGYDRYRGYDSSRRPGDGPRYRRGGSSKHKKKHPRSTNKRKLLVKRIRRRSMKHKKKR